MIQILPLRNPVLLKAAPLEVRLLKAVSLKVVLLRAVVLKAVPPKPALPVVALLRAVPFRAVRQLHKPLPRQDPPLLLLDPVSPLPA